MLFTLGGLTFLFWGVRFFAFRLLESPRFLSAKGRDVQAVEVLRKVAKINGVECRLTVDGLRNASEGAVASARVSEIKTVKQLGPFVLAERSLKETKSHMRDLFGSPRMAWSTSLLISLWGKGSIIANVVCSNSGLCSTYWPSFHSVRKKVCSPD